MRSIRWYTTVFWLGLIFVFPPGKLFSQEVEIKNVTVLENNHVQIKWEFHDFPDNLLPVSLYRDTLLSRYRFSDPSIYEITSLSQTTFIDSTVWLNRVRAYQIAPVNQQIQSNKFNTLYVSLSMDTCGKSINLYWTRKFPKQPNNFPRNLNDSITIARYNIWRSIDGGNYAKIKSIESASDTSKIDTTYTEPNIEYDRTYRYYIEGVLQSDTTIKSRSNRISINTDMPDDPEYINLDSLSTRNRNIHLSFSIDEEAELKRYVLLRSQGNRTGPYDTLKSFNQPSQTIRYIDESVDPTRNLYHYHLAAVNQCGALTTRSDTLSNLLLTVTQQNLTHQVNWNQITSLQANIRYDVYRKGGDSRDYRKKKTLYQSPFLDDDIQTYIEDTVSSEFCYYVTARIDHPNGQQSIITSYNRCVYVKPQIFIPNAFIPNAQRPVNRGFRPEFTFIPQHYLLIIYDRSGRKVFQSENPRAKWEGRIQRGQKAPAGTYTYYLEVKNPSAPMIRKRGEITLIYR